MLSKLYEQIKKFLRHYYLELILFFVIYAILMFPIPYVVEAPGGIMDISEKIEIDEKINTKGTYNLAYVSEYRGCLITAILSYIIPDWDLQKIETKDINENQEATYLRNHLMLEEANQEAILLAYRKAGKEVKIKKEMMYITYLDPNIDWELKVGDELLKADGKVLTSKDDLTKIVNQKNVGDTIQMKVKRNNKHLTVPVTVQKQDDKKLLGVIVSFLREIETKPEIEITFKKSESGPSAGFMTALTIYQSLIDKDLANGLKIVGTGTIDTNGNIGSIGGIHYKLMGAEKAKADIFFVPEGENYQDAKKLKEERNYKIKIVKVKTFDDAIKYLEKQK